MYYGSDSDRLISYKFFFIDFYHGLGLDFEDKKQKKGPLNAFRGGRVSTLLFQGGLQPRSSHVLGAYAYIHIMVLICIHWYYHIMLIIYHCRKHAQMWVFVRIKYA